MALLQERVDRLQLATTEGSPLEQLMLREPVTHVERNGTANAGKSSTYVVVFETARKAIFKPFGGQSVPSCAAYQQDRFEVPVHEVVAWRLAYALRGRWEMMVPTAVFRGFDQVGGGVLINWRDGGPDLSVLADARAQVHAAAFWDALIGQQDRHARNFRYETSERRLALIDSGFAFARPGDLYNASLFLQHRRSHHECSLTQHELDALEELVASDTFYGLAEYLAQDRFDAFEKRARRMLATGMLPLPGAF